MVPQDWTLPERLSRVPEAPDQKRDSIRERHIKIANEVKAEVEAIRELPLELNDVFVLKLTNVLYVPSLHRNLISVSRLDDDGYDCHFGNGKCRIVINNK